MIVVRASGLQKSFEAKSAVAGVDFEVSQGQIRGLLGPNGAGKTTLLRMLFGLVRPDAGSIELFGRELRAGEPSALDGVAGFVEEPAFYPHLSGRTNLELLATLDGPEAPGRIEAALDAVGLGARAADRTGGYSTGMRQRLGIAAALLREPRLLLLDEPTSGLDPSGVRDVGRLVVELAARGTAIVLSSHQISELEQLCDTYTFLREGNVVWDGTARELGQQAPASSYSMATSDNDRAHELAGAHAGVSASRDISGALRIEVEREGLDPFVLALAGSGIAVRRLEMVMSPLAAMFFSLTGEPSSAGEPELEQPESEAAVP